jgi:hypothetical protein
MTGLPREQVTELVAMVHQRIGVWQRPRGRRRVLGLFRAVVLVLFLLRHNNAQDVAGELFGCSQSTVSRLWRGLHPVVPRRAGRAGRSGRRAGVPQRAAGRWVPRPDRQPRRGARAVLRQATRQRVQRAGGDQPRRRLIDTGDPLPGSRHDRKAFVDSGIAERFAGHYAPGGLGMTGDKGYLGTGIITADRKPPGGELTDAQKAVQHLGQPHPRRRRTWNRTPEELEDPQDWLPRPAIRVSRPATHRYQT